MLPGNEGNFTITAVFVKDELEKMQALQSIKTSKESKIGTVNE